MSNSPLQQGLRISGIGFLVLALLGVAIWAGFEFGATPETIVEEQVQPTDNRDSPKVPRPKIPFVDISENAGLDFVHVNGATGDKLLPETMGGGCGFFDFDNDGDQDLLLVNSRQWPWDTQPDEQPAISALYENDGTGNFRNITAGSGLEVSVYGMGCAFGDFDGDCLTDIYISCVGKNRLFKNLGEGKFKDVTADAGVAGSENDWSTSSGWFDFDRDGDLDLFVCNYLEWTREYDQSQDFKLTGNERAYGRPQSFGGTVPFLFENQGNGTFTEIAEQAGLAMKNPATDQAISKSLGVSFFDFDSDGDLDVIVANDTVPNFLFENLGDRTFREIGTASGVAYDIDGNARGAMGIDIASIRNSRSIGIAIGNFSNEMTAFYVSPRHDSFFTDEAVSNGLGPQTRLSLTFGVVFADFDLDRRVDLLTANGHLENEINRVLPSQTYEQAPQLFWNAGPKSETEFVPLTATEAGESLFEPIVGRGCAFADIDADGDLDALVTSLHGRPKLFRNDQKLGHNWLRVSLSGTKSGCEAIGALVTITCGDEQQERLVMPTRGYLSQSELPVTFGLGTTNKIDQLDVLWPSGMTTTMTDVDVNQTLAITESEVDTGE